MPTPHFLPPPPFVGLTPFIERAAAQTSVSALHLVRCQRIWHCGQIQEALGQLCKVEPRDRHALLAHAKDIRDSLAATLAGIDAAIAEQTELCAEPTEPEPVHKPVPGKRRHDVAPDHSPARLE